MLNVLVTSNNKEAIKDYQVYVKDLGTNLQRLSKMRQYEDQWEEKKLEKTEIHQISLNPGAYNDN